MPRQRLSHIDSSGKAKMVDVGIKPITRREAHAHGTITLSQATVRAIAAGKVRKGEVLAVARVAGIMAAKRTGELIPLCHPLAVESVEVEFDLPTSSQDSATIQIRSVARISAKTGVEMEALTAVAVAALTIYDMCKAIDKTMVIGAIRLVSKTGGKSEYTGKAAEEMID